MKGLEIRMILKRTMCWSVFLVAAVLSLVSLAGCSNIDEGVSTDSSGVIPTGFSGTWKEEEGSQELTFKEDGSVDGTYFTGVSQFFSYSVEENIVFVYIEGQGKRELHSVAVLNDDGSLTYKGQKYIKS